MQELLMSSVILLSGGSVDNKVLQNGVGVIFVEDIKTDFRISLQHILIKLSTEILMYEIFCLDVKLRHLSGDIFHNKILLFPVEFTVQQK
jgi:hypothetical protein